MTATTKDETGPCDCDGGWRHVSQEYVDRQAPWPDLSAIDEAARAAIIARIDQLRAAHADSVYPCRRCRSKQFFRWAGGHYDRDHIREDCSDCMADMPATRRRGRRREYPSAPDPEPVPAGEIEEF